MKDPIDNLEGTPPTEVERAAMARELDAVAPTPADKFQLMFGPRSTPTPRMDAAFRKCGETPRMNWQASQCYDAGCKLERELADSIRERDNAESDRRQAEADAIRALHERNEARGQRDRLATALRQCMPIIGKPGCPAEWKWASDDVLDKAWKDGQAALDSLQGGACD
jgi:hypothetical protein